MTQRVQVKCLSRDNVGGLSVNKREFSPDKGGLRAALFVAWSCQPDVAAAIVEGFDLARPPQRYQNLLYIALNIGLGFKVRRDMHLVVSDPPVPEHTRPGPCDRREGLCRPWPPARITPSGRWPEVMRCLQAAGVGRNTGCDAHLSCRTFRRVGPISGNCPRLRPVWHRRRPFSCRDRQGRRSLGVLHSIAGRGCPRR